MEDEMETVTKFKVGDRLLVTMLEDNSIGEMEFIEPTPSPFGTKVIFHAKWWDGDLFNGHGHVMEADRIVERTPENIAKAGKQTFAAIAKATN
jgi:hypothetical protein